MSQPISDELIAHVGPILLPVKYLTTIAHDVLGLTQDQCDAECFTPSMLTDPIQECLRLGLSRKHINTIQQLKTVLEAASINDVISWNVISYLDRLIRQNRVKITHEVSKEVCRHITPDIVQVLFTGYFGLTIEDIKHQQPQPLDHKTVCVRILSLWRRLNHGCNSAQHLIHALERTKQRTINLFQEESTEACTDTPEILDKSFQKSTSMEEAFTIYDEIIAAVKNKLQVLDADEQVNQPDNKCCIIAMTTKERLYLRLKDRYDAEYRKLNPMPWVSSIPASMLNDVFISLFVEELGHKTSRFSINDLLDQCCRGNSKMAKLILVHGEAGSGKTTLTGKLGLDWATKDTQITNLLQYDAVFIIKATLLEEDDTLSSFIKREYVPEFLNSWRIENELCYAKTLIIIDGYDEKCTEKDFISDLLSRRIMPGSTIIVTSRYGSTKKIRSIFDIEVGICSLTPQDVESFVHKYGDEVTKKNILEIYAKCHPFVETLSNPMYLWIFVLLGEESFRDVQNYTRTDFYSQTILGICDKVKHKLSTNNGDGSLVCDLEAAIESLCMLAYQCMKEDTLQVRCESYVDEVMSKLGLLNKTISRLGVRDRTIFTFAHKAIMEFLTAKYLTSTRQPVFACLSELPEVQSELRRKSSMVMLFVIGLLAKKKREISDIIQRFVPDSDSYKDSHADHLGLSCLCELEDTPNVSMECWKTKIKSSLEIDSKCTPYCIRGVEKYSKAEQLVSLKLKN